MTNKFGDRFLGYVPLRGTDDLAGKMEEIQRYMPRGYTTSPSTRLHSVLVWCYLCRADGTTDDSHDRYVRDRLASGLWFLQDHDAEERVAWTAERLQDDRLPFYTEDVAS